jgi:hypothetical protein
MQTTGLAPFSVVPLPHQLNQYFPGQFQFGGPANSDQIHGMVFSEATSTFYLSTVLQRLSDPTLSCMDPKELTDTILQHAKSLSLPQWLTCDRNAAVGVDLMCVSDLPRLM